MTIQVRGGKAHERQFNGYGAVALATASCAFEVRVRNSNRSTYCVRLFVDGKESEPGYIKKLRGEDETTFVR